MRMSGMKIYLVSLALLLVSCAATRQTEETRHGYPEAAFDKLCEAYMREDYQAVYNSFSSRSKKLLAESQDAIKDASGYRNLISPAIEELKRKANGAKIVITLKMEDYAQGIVKWSDGAEQDIWFTRENGVWKIDIAFEQTSETEQPSQPKP